MSTLKEKMKKYKAGSFYFDEEENYYTDDFVTFYKENDEALNNDDLEQWAVWFNSSWSQAHESYEIRCNCKDAYTQMDENEPTWKCKYSIVGYEGISASVFGYGNTEVEALENCKNHFQMLQDKYNTENESI